MRRSRKRRLGKILRPLFQFVQMNIQFQIIQMNTIFVAGLRRRS